MVILSPDWDGQVQQPNSKLKPSQLGSQLAPWLDRTLGSSHRNLCAEPHPQGCDPKSDTFLNRLGKGSGTSASPTSSSISGQKPPALPCFPIILALPGCARTSCATVPPSPTKAGAAQPSPRLLCSHQKDSGWETRSSSNQREAHLRGTMGGSRVGTTLQAPTGLVSPASLHGQHYRLDVSHSPSVILALSVLAAEM